MRLRLALVWLAVGLAACGDVRGGTAVVAGKTVFRGMAVEEVRLAAYAVEAAGGTPVVRGRSGYHGSFSLRLAPGTYRLEGRGQLPHRQGGTLALGGQVTVTVPASGERTDRVLLPLHPLPGE